MPAPDTESFNVGARGFGYTKPVECQQRDQCVLSGLAKSGGDQARAELVAVQPRGGRVIGQPGTADMSGRGVIQQLFLHLVPVEAGDCVSYVESEIPYVTGILWTATQEHSTECTVGG
jgi:hypothetical protein